MFLAPLFLFGLLAAAIPLVLHLRRSTRVRKIPFSTTRFFDEQFIRSSRRARFQDLFLMLLRIALLVLFVLALAQPLFRLPGLGALTGGRRNVAIVLDDSASMGLVGDRGTLLDRAKRGALALLDDLSPTRGDRVTLVLAGRRESGAKVLFSELTTDLAAVRSAIAAVHVTDLGTDLNGAIDAAGHLLSGGTPTQAGANASGDREIYVFSDLQSSAFAPGQLVSPGPGVALLLVSTRADHGLAAEDASVDAIQYGAPQPMIGVPFAFRALLTNHSDRPRAVSANLVIDGQILAQKQTELPPGRGKIVRFVHRFTKAGWYRGSIDLGPPAPAAGATATAATDSLEVNNRRYFTLHVDEKVRLLAINGAPSAVVTSDELFFFRLALTVNPGTLNPTVAEATRAAGPIQLDQGTPADLVPSKLAEYPLVVLANVPAIAPEALEALELYVDAGGNLFITLGDRIDAKSYNAWIGESRLHGGLLPGRLAGLVGDPKAGSAPSDATGDAGFIASAADEHPALAGFADGQFGNLSAVHFSARYNLDAPADAVLMRAPNGDPLLAEKRFGRGRVLLFASSIDRDWTNFPLQSAYVPWLYRLVGYLAQGTLEGGGFVRTGQVVTLPSSATQVEALQVECPDGTIAYPQPASSRATGASRSAGGMELAPIEQAGIYALRSVSPPLGGRAGRGDPTDSAAAPLPTSPKGERTTPRMLFAANVPSDEADANDLDEKALRALIDPQASWAYVDAPESAVDAGQLARRGYGLWDQLLFLALLVGLLEPWLANRLSRRRAQHVADALSKRDVAARTARQTMEPAA